MQQPTSLMLTVEELWFLARSKGRASFVGADFAPLEHLSQDEQARVLDWAGRALWAHRILGGNLTQRQIYIREPASSLMAFGTMPEQVYFYGQRRSAGQEVAYYFLRRGDDVVVHSQPLEGVHHLLRLPSPKWAVQTVASGVHLAPWQEAPEPFHAVLPQHMLATVFQQREKLTLRGEDLLSLLESHGFSRSAAAALVHTVATVQVYHALARLDADMAESSRGFTLVQGERFVWRFTPLDDEKTACEWMTQDTLLAALRAFFQLPPEA